MAADLLEELTAQAHDARRGPPPLNPLTSASRPKDRPGHAQPQALTQRQQIWVQHYAASGNARAAADLAGYSPRNLGRAAHQNLTNAKLMRAVAEIHDHAAKHVSLTVADIMEGLISEARDPTNAGSVRVSAWRALQQMVPGALVPIKVQSEHTERHEVGLTPERERQILEGMLGCVLPIVDVDVSPRAVVRRRPSGELVEQAKAP